MSRSIISDNKDIIKQSSNNGIIKKSKSKSTVFNVKDNNPEIHKSFVKATDSEMMKKAIKGDMSSSLKSQSKVNSKDTKTSKVKDKRGIGKQNKPKQMTRRDQIYRKSLKKSFSKTSELRTVAKYGTKYTAKAAKYTVKASNKVVLPTAKNVAENFGKSVILTALESDNGEIQNVTNKAITTVKTAKAAKKTAKATKKSTKATYKTTKTAIKGAYTASKAIIKATIATVSFVVANLPIILIVLAIVLIVVVLITVFTSIFSGITLKSDDVELTKAYSYMTELDASYTAKYRNYEFANDVSSVEIYLNDTLCETDDFEIKTDVDLVLAWFDAEYEDYAFDAKIFGLFGGTNIKEEIEEIWEDLYYDNITMSTDEQGNLITQIYVYTESFDDFVQRNIPENQEAYEMMKEVGVYTTKAEILKPFDFYTILNRYGYYCRKVTNWAGTTSIQLFKHTGVDIKAEEGTEVKSGISGTVGLVDYSPVLGYYVIIKSSTNEDTSITYCKLKDKHVKLGQKVKRGDVIGYVGNTGAICSESGTCLHMEYLKNGENVVPSMYFINNGNSRNSGETNVVPGGGNGTLRYPTNSKTVSAGYPNYSNGSYHGGVDFPVPMNTDVCAAEDGKVVFAGTAPPDNNGGYGNYVVIEHTINGQKIATLYGHNTTLLVSAGDVVKRGQVIAKSGSTGNSTGPHVHFEVQIGGMWGTRVNPFIYLK